MLKIIWIIFSFIFLCLTIFHFYRSAKKIEKPRNKAEIKTFNGVNLGIHEFIEDFLKYLDTYDRDNRNQNLAAGFGYLLATITAIISIFLSN